MKFRHKFWIVILITITYYVSSKSLYQKVLSSLPGTYSFFSPKITDKDTKINQNIINSYTKDLDDELLSKEDLSPMIENFDTSLNISLILDKFILGTDVLNEKYRKYLLSNDNLVLSLKSSPFGWKNYGFKIIINNNLKNKKNKKNTKNSSSSIDGKNILSQIDFLSVYPITKSGDAIGNKRIRIQYSIEIVENDLVLISRYASKGISENQVNLIKTSIDHYIKLQLRKLIELAMVRKKQIISYQINSIKQTKEKKKYELDRIMNPEKYKSRSPTVRRVGSSTTSNSNNKSGKSGYQPSAATQARRQVKSR